MLHAKEKIARLKVFFSSEFLCLRLGLISLNESSKKYWVWYPYALVEKDPKRYKILGYFVSE